MAYANSAAFTLLSSQPFLIFTVTGTFASDTAAFTISADNSVFFINAAPEPFPATFGTGQPIFISMISGLYLLIIFTAFFINSGSLPNSCSAHGLSFSVILQSSSVFLSL